MILYDGLRSTNISYLVLAGEDIYLCLHQMNLIVVYRASVKVSCSGGRWYLQYDSVVR